MLESIGRLPLLVCGKLPETQGLQAKVRAFTLSDYLNRSLKCDLSSSIQDQVSPRLTPYPLSHRLPAMIESLASQTAAFNGRS